MRQNGPKHVRGATVVAKILETTLMEIVRVGYDRLTIEGVARAAGVNKTTIYRRWPNTHDLTHAALLNIAESSGPPPNTGQLRSDLVQLMVAGFGALRRSPHVQALGRMHAGGLLKGEIAELVDSLRRSKQEQFKLVLKRAVARGELPRSTDVELLFAIFAGTMQNFLIFRREELDEEQVREIVDTILSGAQNARPAAKARAKRGMRRATKQAKRRST